MTHSIRAKDIFRAFVCKWKIIVFVTLLGAILGLSYAATYAEDNDPFPYKGSAECAVLFTEVGDDSTYSAKTNLLGKWTSVLAQSDDVYAAILEDPEVKEAFFNEDDELSIATIKSLVSYSFDTNTSVLSITTKARSEDKASILLRASVSSFNEVVNSVFAKDLGTTDVRIMSDSITNNISSGASLKQIAGFGLVGLIAGLCIAALLVLVRNYVSYSSLIDRYTLPVYGPFGKKQTTSKEFLLKEEARISFPEKSLLVPAGKVSKNKDMLAEQLKKQLPEGTEIKLVDSVDEVISSHDEERAIIIVVNNNDTTHREVSHTLCVLDAYGLEVDAFCLFE